MQLAIVLQYHSDSVSSCDTEIYVLCSDIHVQSEKDTSSASKVNDRINRKKRHKTNFIFPHL